MNNAKALLDYFVSVLNQVYSITPNRQILAEMKQTIEMYVSGAAKSTMVIPVVMEPVLAPPEPEAPAWDERRLKRVVASLEAENSTLRHQLEAARTEAGQVRDLIRQIYRAAKPIIDREVEHG